MSSTVKFSIDAEPNDDEWYFENSNGTPECISNWTIEKQSNLDNRLSSDDDGSYVILERDDTLKIPFKSGDLSLVDNAKFVLKIKQVANVVFDDSFTIETSDGAQYQLPFTASEDVLELEFTELSNCDYIKIINSTLYSTPVFYIYIDSYLDIKTNEYDINTELDNFSINLRNKANLTVGNTIVSTSLGFALYDYTTESIILTDEEEKELAQLCDLARLNEYLICLYIDVFEKAGNTPAGIPSGGEKGDNIVKYYYKGHPTTTRTGLYHYLKLSYTKDRDEYTAYL